MRHSIVSFRGLKHRTRALTRDIRLLHCIAVDRENAV
jgi:hypothetical protein